MMLLHRSIVLDWLASGAATPMLCREKFLAELSRGRYRLRFGSMGVRDVPRRFFARSADFTKRLLYSGLLIATSVSGLVWSGDPNRERGGYGSYDQPIERPTLPTPSQRSTDSAPSAASQANVAAESAEVELMRAERMVGRPIVAADGAALGEVRAIVRSKQDHSLQAVVVIGGPFGFGSKQVVVPVDQLTMRPGDGNGPL
ncbi:MAG TPA: PRC-barrel domain-containing protein, partial [Gammaproteobacteria bacterium]|nr:PRC-barrel domain-containing protein [Gammaproteobacteria bacterium]